MSEQSQVETTEKRHPSADRIEHLRHQIIERFPAARRIFTKSGTEPTKRELINAAGDRLRQEYESDFDPLTGLLDLKGYKKNKTLALNKARNEKTPVAIAVIDLDDLKKTNDTLGHSAGDKYLKDASDAIKTSSRESDVKARVGGDEFEVLLLDVTPDQAKAWKERMNSELESRQVKASIGISEVDFDNFDASKDSADKKMYEEKRRRKSGA